MTVVQRDSAVFEATIRQVRAEFPRTQFYVRPLDWTNDSTPNIEGISPDDARRIVAHRESTLFGLGASLQPSALLDCPPATRTNPIPPSCVAATGTSIALPDPLESELRVAANVRADANVFTYYFTFSHGKWAYERQDAPMAQ
jgi:hypothetical protein